MDLREIESDEKHYTREWYTLTPLKFDINNNHFEFCPIMIIALVIMLTTPSKFLQVGIVLKTEIIKDYLRSTTISQERFLLHHCYLLKTKEKHSNYSYIINEFASKRARRILQNFI
jgi:hypothetical protein